MGMEGEGEDMRFYRHGRSWFGLPPPPSIDEAQPNPSGFGKRHWQTLRRCRTCGAAG